MNSSCVLFEINNSSETKSPYLYRENEDSLHNIKLSEDTYDDACTFLAQKPATW
jgi:hypothetical protein